MSVDSLKKICEATGAELGVFATNHSIDSESPLATRIIAASMWHEDDVYVIPPTPDVMQEYYDHLLVEYGST